MARCIFVKERECPIEGEEIPLEVCRLCIEAAKTFRESLSVAEAPRPSGRSEKSA